MSVAGVVDAVNAVSTVSVAGRGVQIERKCVN